MDDHHLKRERPQSPYNGSDGAKKSRPETESCHSGLGSKPKPCQKFFSTSGCPFGDKCYFSHYVPGGFNAVSQLIGTSRAGGRFEPPPRAHGAAAGFGASATAKISIDSSHAGTIIGKNGVNSKHICHMTGVKLSVRGHESNPSLNNIELEGSFDQIKQASAMVHDLIGDISHASQLPLKSNTSHTSAFARFFKTRMCQYIAKGYCPFGERCHFAHGAHELRKTGM